MNSGNIVLAAAAVLSFSSAATAAEPVDWVNPEIGNISHMLVPTFPTTQLPNGMYRFCAPGRNFADDRIPPLPLFIPSHRGRGLFTVHPAAGEDAFAPWRGTWDDRHGLPYLSSFVFDEEEVAVRLAPAAKGAVMTFDFRSEGRHALVFAPTDAAGGFSADASALRGTDRAGTLPVYFHGVFEPAPTQVAKKGGRVALAFGSSPEKVVLRFAVSSISVDQAKANFAREVGGRSVEEVAAAARAAWNAKLGKILVEGGSEDERKVFYTALYRVYERMVNCTEDGRYVGYDRQIHETGGVDYYNDDWTWDTYRAAHPLMCLLEPTAQTAKLTSYVRMARENPEGWVPLFPNLDGDRHGMNGFHPPALFLDAWRKGVKGVDWKAAFAALAHTERTSSRLPWNRGPRFRLDDFYDTHGYFPALHPAADGGWAKDPDWPAWAKHDERRQAVAVTLAYSYDCWCLAELAKTFGTEADVAEFTRKSRFFRNLWNAKTGFFHPKDESGAFIQPFDYSYAGGQGARDYYDENNAWTYIWDVPHALPELVGMLGGRAAASAKLDRMFNEPYRRPRWDFYRVLPDSTGNMGMFTMGNEPSFHIPYMYNFTGEPWKTQKLVRKILKAWFRNDLMGMCGDEDGGGMSAFAVFSMMGFYPVTPGLPEYQLGSPVFEKATISLENGRRIVLRASGASEDVKYVRQVGVNGRPVAGTAITHADLVAGGEIVFEMSDRPSKSATLRVGTYNIRTSGGGNWSADGGTPNVWSNRCDDLVATIRRMDLDAFGLQEVMPRQLTFLAAALPEFAFVGEHRGADRRSDEASPVAYRRSKFDELKKGTFWLSETPDVPGRKGWGAACPRVCSYLVLRDRRSGARFCFANTHTDHVSEEAREKGMMLVIERMREFGSGAPIVFTGDHNCRETEAPARAVSKILRNALDVSQTPPTGSWRTWNGWRWRPSEVSTAEALKLSPAERNSGKRGDPGSFYERCGGPRIDYIYVSRDIKVLDYATVNDSRPGVSCYPSDHFPIVATISLP